MSRSLSTNGCSPTKFACRNRKEEKRPRWWGYNERSRRGWCSTTPPKSYERRNAGHPQQLKTSRSVGGAAAGYAHMHKLLVSLPPDPPPSFPAAILELKLAYFLSEQWGPPHFPLLMSSIALLRVVSSSLSSEMPFISSLSTNELFST